MYRVLIQTGDIKCSEYEQTNHGVDLYEEDDFIAFVPYENLFAIVDESTMTAEDRSIL
jgi:hypothetical protein